LKPEELQMKRIIPAVLALCLIISLAACGTSQSDYDAVTAERDSLRTQLSTLTSEKNSLQSEYDKLKTETADWLALSDAEKAAASAQAEADRVAAENAAKQAAADSAAAEEKARQEAEQKAAEEEAARLAAEKIGYDTGITYSQLARTPDDYTDKKVKFYGEVIQVVEGDDETDLRIAVNGDYNTIILVYYPSSLIKSRVLEDDYITIYGVSKGLYTYESTGSGKITIPLISVDKIDQ
jgi:hypothetical protein